jgi:AraC-like DNA-binding protein
MAADVLSDLLKTVRLTGAAFFEVAAQEPWAVASPPRELILPKILPDADHLIAYHVVTAGRCFATVSGGQPIALEAGEVIVITRSEAHVMSSRPGLDADPPAQTVIEVAAAAQKPFRINYGDGPLTTNLVCGYLACDARPFNPLLENLPPVIKAGDTRNNGAGWVGQFIRFAVAEAADRRAGGATVLTKMSELLFIEVVRRYLDSLPPEHAGWLAGLRDPFIGQALSMIHARPAHDWTLDELAKGAGLSRSVLAERFAGLVGVPPMHYLAKWRMQKAVELLIGANMNLAGVAAEIGYESEAAFSRAFKKIVGVSPSVWRQNGASGRIAYPPPAALPAPAGRGMAKTRSSTV